MGSAGLLLELFGLLLSSLGVFLGLFGGALGTLRVPFGARWTPFGFLWRPLGVLWGGFGVLQADLRALWSRRGHLPGSLWAFQGSSGLSSSALVFYLRSSAFHECEVSSRHRAG